MMTSVNRALRLVGSRKAPTPLEMASRPVSDAPPLAKARRMTMKVAPYSHPDPVWPKLMIGLDGVPAGMAWACRLPMASRKYPATTTNPRLKMKK